MIQREGKSLEYKDKLSKTYLKTVSAYANYNDGIIIFGISDKGTVVGITDPLDTCLSIETQINNTIHPKPDYSLTINKDNTITLSVKKGLSTPYKYNNKAYIRNNSGTVEVDFFQERRLILEGMNLSFEELPCKKQTLSFDFLGEQFRQQIGLSVFDTNILKTLNLLNDKTGFNNAAMLLADDNNCLGLDIVVFGNSINEFKHRETFNNYSILKQYYDSLEIYEREYTFEKIEDGFRKKYERIPYEAFREAIANALIHRDWDINANIKVEMHPDRISITSPGGLVSGINEEEFMEGKFSCLRNPIITEVFHRLNIVEKFATGIQRIQKTYESSMRKPSFDITYHSISITLPVIEEIILTEDEKSLLAFMQSGIRYHRQDIEKAMNEKKDTLLRTLNALIQKGMIVKNGVAKATTYQRKQL